MEHAISFSLNLFTHILLFFFHFLRDLLQFGLTNLPLLLELFQLFFRVLIHFPIGANLLMSGIQFALQNTNSPSTILNTSLRRLQLLRKNENKYTVYI